MTRVCLQRESEGDSSCLELDYAGTMSERDFWGLTTSPSSSESLVAVHRNDPSGLSQVDVYRVSSEGNPLTVEEISQISGGRAPYLWRHSPLRSVSVGDEVFSSENLVCAQIQGLTLLTTDRQIYHVPLSHDQNHAYHLNYQGTSISAAIYSHVINAYGDQLIEEHRRGGLNLDPPDPSVLPPPFDHDTENFEELRCLDWEESSRLDQVFEGLDVPPPQRVPLVYDPWRNPVGGSLAYYAEGPLVDPAFPLSFIGVGDEFLGRTPGDQAAILAHEVGHHRYHQEMGQTFSNHLIGSILFQFEEAVSPGTPLPTSTLQGLYSALSLLSDHGHSAESEIYADLVAMEWLNRQEGEVCREGSMRAEFAEHARIHLNLIQERWHRPIAAIALSELVYLFSSDPHLSEATQNFACSLFRETLNPDLRGDIQFIHQIDADPAPEIAAGVRPYNCWDRLGEP